MGFKFDEHPSVIRFLDQVCSQVKGSHKKREVREEILSHIEAELEATEENLEEAIHQALQKFGDPYVLGRSLRMAQRTWPQRLLAYSISATALGFLILYFSSAYFIHHYRDVLENVNLKIASRIPRFEAERKSLARMEFLRETSSTHADAGPFLNTRVSWGIDGQSRDELIPDVASPAWRNAWMTADIPEELKSADLTWMAQLQAFDHWDLFKSGPNARFIGAKAERINPFAVPMPGFEFVSRAARLRLRRGLDSKSIVPALKEVRHLARLSYTTETLVGSMVAVGVWKMERAAYDEAIRRGILSPSEYEAMDPDVLKRMKTTLWATVGFADYSAPEIVKHAFLDSPSWPVGSCAALGETSQHIVLAAEFLKKKYPLEADLDQRQAIVENAFEKSKPHCRLTFHRQLVARYQDYADIILEPTSYSVGGGWKARLENLRFAYGRYVPYVRQGLGLELLAAARPDFSGLYERE